MQYNLDGFGSGRILQQWPKRHRSRIKKHLLCILTSPPVSVFQFMQWSQQHTQISSLCPSLVSLGSLPSAQQLRWLWFHSWAALLKRPRLPRSALWRAWRPPRVALRWGAMRARARHLMLRANLRCHRTRYVSLLLLRVFALLYLLQHLYNLIRLQITIILIFDSSVNYFFD